MCGLINGKLKGAKVLRLFLNKVFYAWFVFLVRPVHATRKPVFAQRRPEKIWSQKIWKKSGAKI
jgi:hypothetical protein